MKRCRPALGTFVEITLPDGVGHCGCDDQQVDAIDRAFDAIRAVESRMSFHAVDSDLTRLNRLAHRAPQRVDASTYEVLATAKDVYARTDGLFDCAVGARLVEWDLLPHHDGSVGDPRTTTATLADLDLLTDDRIAYRRPMCLDLGGIAKGYAVDRAIEALQACAVTRAIVNAGGDLRVLGPVAMPIHLRDPADPRRLLFAGDLSDGAMATSAVYWSTHDSQGRTRSALVDPRSGDAVLDARSVSVLAPTCMVADALTKAVAAAGDAPSDFLAHYGAQALIVPAALR